MKMKRFFIILAILLTLPAASFGLYWEKINGDHFIVNFSENKDRPLAQEVLAKAEVFYNRIADNLGYPRYSDFWSWDKRVNIFIYPDSTSYFQATGQPEWSDGVADYKNKQISTYAGNQKFSETVLPHEISHLIFRDFIGFKGDVPLWLDEGVATSTQEETYADMQSRAKSLYQRSALLTLDDMMTIDFKKTSKGTSVHDILMKDNSKGILMLKPEDFVAVYYVEATSVVGFLKERYGPTRFTEFCRELRDGKTLDKALQKVYPEECPNIKELEKKWRQYLAQGT